jgi:hypothetical protein
VPPECTQFVAGIAEALRRELGSKRSAVKTAAAWTGANERTVKNWLSGRGAPCGFHLVSLARNSDEVLQVFLVLAGRGDLVAAKKLMDVRGRLHEMLTTIDELIGVSARAHE